MQDVITVLDAVCDKLGVAIDWSAENVAPKLEAFVARYSTYLIAVHIFYLALAVLVLAGGVTAMVLTWRSYQKRGWAYDNYGSTSMAGYGVVTCGIMAAVIAAICAGAMISTLIQLATVPEIAVANDILSMISCHKKQKGR